MHESPPPIAPGFLPVQLLDLPKTSQISAKATNIVSPTSVPPVVPRSRTTILHPISLSEDLRSMIIFDAECEEADLQTSFGIHSKEIFARSCCSPAIANCNCFDLFFYWKPHRPLQHATKCSATANPACLPPNIAKRV